MWIKDVFKVGGILDKMDKEAVCTFFLLFAWSGDTRIMKTPGTINFDGIGLSEEQYCHKLRMTPEKFREMTKILCENEMITYEKGIITIVNFKYWQDKKTGEDEDEPKLEFKNEPKFEPKNEVEKLRSREVKNLRSKKEPCEPVGSGFVAYMNEILDCWNKIPGIITCKVLTDKLKTILKQRLNDRFFFDNWKEAMRKVFHSPFLRGQTEKGEEHGNWKPDFDWFIRPDGKKTASVVLIMEGKYDQKEKVREAD